MARRTALLVDPSNAGQLQAWDGPAGEFWAAQAESFDRAVAGYDRPFLDAASIEPPAAVLDIGCGTGATTRAAARLASSGSALGVDLSAPMLRRAREAAAREGLRNVRFEQADAQVHPFPEGAFDRAISRAGAMFFGDPAAAFANITRALRPAGRLVLLVWQPFARNEWIRSITGAVAAGRDLPPPPPDAPGPFSMADPDRVHSLLLGAGFADPRLEALEVPLCFGTSADAAYDFASGLSRWMLEGLDDDGRARALDALRATVEEHATDSGVFFGSAAWLITASRAA